MSQGVAFPLPPLTLLVLSEACAALSHSHSLACSWKRVSISGLGKAMQLFFWQMVGAFILITCGVKMWQERKEKVYKQFLDNEVHSL